jgi:hypothetical protein
MYSMITFRIGTVAVGVAAAILLPTTAAQASTPVRAHHRAVSTHTAWADHSWHHRWVTDAPEPVKPPQPVPCYTTVFVGVALGSFVTTTTTTCGNVTFTVQDVEPNPDVSTN